MAGSIKGITIEFDGNTTKLDKALKDVDRSTSKIDKELKQVNNALKFNPKNVELLRQKQELLSKKIEETTKRLDMLKQTQAKVDSGEIEMSAEDYRTLQREIITTESKLKTFNGQLDKTSKTIKGMDMQKVSEKFKGIGEGLTNAGNAMKPISAAGAAVTAGLGAMAVKAGMSADDLNTLAKVTGIGTKDLQKYAAAADLVDVSVEALAKGNQKLKQNMYNASQGSKTQQKAFKALGISVTDSNGNLRDSDDVFQEVITALGKMDNETERDALAMKLMGKSAAELNPLLADQGETYKAVSDTLKKYNLDYLDQETLDKANQFNDSLDTMKAIGTVAFQTVGAQLAGYLAPALEKMVDLFGRFASWLGNLSPQVLTVIGIVGSVIAVIAPLLLILGKISFAISSITGLMGTLGLSFGAIAGPIGIAIAAIAAIIAIGVLLYKNWDKIKAKAAEIKKNLINQWNTIKSKVVGAVNSLKNSLSSAWNSIKATVSAKWNAIKEAITKPIQTAKDKVKGIIDKIKGIFPINIGRILSNIETPHFSLQWGTKDFGKLGSVKYPTGFNVSWWKTGGIFDSPSIIGIGEAGPEAVVPLDKLWNKLDAMQSGQTNNFYITGDDPKQIAKEVERILIRNTKNKRLAFE